MAEPITMTSTDEFTCAMCGETFKKGWSEEEALSEREHLFGGKKRPSDAVVCDVCFQRMIRKVPPPGLKR